VQIGTATTTANGTYSLTYSDSQGVHTYYAIFAGDTTYGLSNVGCSVSVGNLTPSTITITSNNTTPAVNQSFTLSGTLTSNGTAVPGKTITLERVNSSGTWVQIGTATTTANGTYSLTYSDSQGVHTYYAIFAGDTTYGPSNVGCSVSVGTITPTTITITIITDDPNPAVNQSFTLSGTLSILTVGTAPLSGETITLDRVDPSGTWTQVNTTTTTNGTYSFTRSESSQGTYSYYAVFAGDTAYGPSNAGVTLPVGNLQRSDIRILATNNTPAANQSYTLYGFLQDGVSGVPLVGQPIVLTVEGPSGQIAANAYTNTDANGAYAFTTSESAPGTYVCTVTFYGSSTYFISSTMCNVIIGNSIPTKLSLNISDSTPAVNQSFSISGYLTDINGTPLSGRVIFVVARLPSGEWVSRGGTITDSNGYYFVPLMSKQIPGEQIPGQYRYEVSFAGDGAYAQAVSEVEVAVGGPLQATNISINSTVAHPSVGEPFTLSGTLTDATGKPLAGEEIDLYRNVAGQQLQEGNIFQERYTDQNGYYLFVLNESTSGTYKYTAKFLGDETHAYSPLASVTLSVGTLTPSTITITSNNTTPAVNQSFTLSGILTVGTAPLSGETITLDRVDPSGTWTQVNTTTTATNGTYSFTRSESSQGTYSYYAVFAGDTAYGPSNAGVASILIHNLTPSTITITTNNTTPAVNQQVTFNATLSSGTTPLSGENVTIYHYLNGVRSNDTTNTTNATGQITVTTSFGSHGTRTYYASFAGDSSYQAATSSVLAVNVTNVTKMATALTIAAPASALTKQNFTVNGTLSASVVGTGNATITLQRSTDNATWTNVTTNVTDANGTYQFSNSETAPNIYYYRSSYDGNDTYANATSNTVSVQVRNPTQLSAAINLSSVAINVPFTINGTLNTTDGTPVAGATIQLQKNMSGTWTDVTGETNTTTSTGAYSISTSEPTAYADQYRTTYAGNATYTNATSSSVSVKVAASIAGAPVVSAQNANSLDLFFRGTDNALWWKHWNGTTWSAATSQGGILTSDPAAISPGTNQVDVFVRGNDSAIWVNTTTNGGSSWSGWQSLGGQIPAGTAPSVCSWGSGRIDLFVQGTDGALWHKWYSGGSWSGWQSLGGKLTSSAAAAAAPGSSRIDVFVRGTDGAIWQRTTTNGGSSWSGWTSRGGQIPVNTIPAACSWGSGRLDLFANGTDGQLWWMYTTNGGSSWSGWQSLGRPLGESLTSSPTAAAPASGIMDVFVRGGDNGLWERTYNSGSWSGWTSIAI
jgi:protocatechuate 3,4-dioxygenase beta subunit